MSDNLAAALAAFQAEMPRVAKNKKATVPMKSGGNYSYTYADLADVSAAAMPLLASHGLAFSCCPRLTDQGNYELAGVLMHTSGEKQEGALPINGRQPQEIGSALTYARRYLLGCITGIVTDDDDDGTLANPAPRTEPLMTGSQRSQMFVLFDRKGVPEESQLSGINQITNKQYDSRGALTQRDAAKVIDTLKKRPDAPTEPAATEGGDPA